MSLPAREVIESGGYRFLVVGGYLKERDSAFLAECEERRCTYAAISCQGRRQRFTVAWDTQPARVGMSWEGRRELFVPPDTAAAGRRQEWDAAREVVNTAEAALTDLRLELDVHIIVSVPSRTPADLPVSETPCNE